MNRRDFLKLFGSVAIAGAVPVVMEHPKQEMRPEVGVDLDAHEYSICGTYAHDKAVHIAIEEYDERIRRADEALALKAKSDMYQVSINHGIYMISGAELDRVGACELQMRRRHKESNEKFRRRVIAKITKA